MEFIPGIFFGLDEDEYHSVPALSNSGIKDLLVSPMLFWAKTPWLNPGYERNSTEAMLIGRAYDKRVVEGKEAFYSTYCALPDKADHPDALDGGDALRAKCSELGLPKGGSIAALCDRLTDADPNLDLWPLILREAEEEGAGKQPLSAALIKEIEIAALMIEADEELSKAFTGGHPQVSIFWIDPQTGVRMKCRQDYLKWKAIVDLKTFGNHMKRPIDLAIARAFADERYHVQASVYLKANEQIPHLIRDKLVYGLDDWKWLRTLRKTRDREMVFIFQQKGIAPVTRGRTFPKGGAVHQQGEAIVEQAQRTFARYMEHMGTDPWIDSQGLQPFADEDFPLYILE